MRLCVRARGGDVGEGARARVLGAAVGDDSVRAAHRLILTRCTRSPDALSSVLPTAPSRALDIRVWAARLGSGARRGATRGGRCGVQP